MTGSKLLHNINTTVLSCGQGAFWWLGQLGYALKLAGKTVYIDAFLTPREDRTILPVIDAAQITNADIVIGTHNHLDHIDGPAWKEIAKASPQAVFVVPALLKEEVSKDLEIPTGRFYGVEDGQTIHLNGISISGIASAHEFLDRDEASGSYPYLGYIIQADGLTLYHSGDTCIYDGLAAKIKAYAPLDAVFLPINGRDAARYRTGCIGNMTFQEAVDLTGTLCPGVAVPGHYDMFLFNSEDPQKYAAYLEAKYPGIPYWIGGYGECVKLPYKNNDLQFP